MMALNLDDFLLVNNNLGLRGGNAIMAQAARTLQNEIGSIGKELRIPIVAEGVETSEQAQQVRSLGVRYAQGWFCARAMTGDDCGWWLSNNLKGRTHEEAAASDFMGLT